MSTAHSEMIKLSWNFVCRCERAPISVHRKKYFVAECFVNWQQFIDQKVTKCSCTRYRHLTIISFSNSSVRRGISKRTFHCNALSPALRRYSVSSFTNAQKPTWRYCDTSAPIGSEKTQLTNPKILRTNSSRRHRFKAIKLTFFYSEYKIISTQLTETFEFGKQVVFENFLLLLSVVEMKVCKRYKMTLSIGVFTDFLQKKVP